MIKALLIAAAGILAIGMGTAAALFLPRFLAQEAPPLVGHGALSRVAIVNSSKCSAVITYAAPGDVAKDAEISLPPGQCSKVTGEEIAANATFAIQDALDFCQPVSSLPEADPDKTIDPNRKSLKWVLKPDGFTYLCSSPVKVKVTWDGTEYNLEWRSTN